MPKKSRRVASRQAQLSGRAKRVRTHGPAGIPTTKPPSPAREPHTDSRTPAETRPSSEIAPQEAPSLDTSRPTTAPPPRPRGRAPQLRPIETYFAPELRRIGVTSAVIFTLLAILVFLLR
ncbi:hypothetical protein ACFLX9_00205 [Chloroflexota bacterium]